MCFFFSVREEWHLSILQSDESQREKKNDGHFSSRHFQMSRLRLLDFTYGMLKVNFMQ